VQLQTFIKAMADNSLLHILAEPNLVAISGETASFLAGGEFPIPVPQGNQQVTIEFREFGVRLNFTPVVLGQQMVRLRVAPEVSELDFSTAVQIEGFVVPGLTSRSTETTVELGSGQTLAIAGLLNEQTRGVASRVPGIGEVPILGALFSSTQYRKSLTELVVMVTPEIVAPLDPHQVVGLPGRDRMDPSDLELYGLGRLDGRRSDAAVETSPSPATANASTTTVPVTATLTADEAMIRGPWGYASATEIP
jgi:pilus assembly protein CpaC